MSNKKQPVENRTHDTPKVSARKAALDALMRIETGGYSNILISAMADEDMSDADRGLAARLILGVTEKRITLDYIIGSLSNRSVSKISVDLRNILRMGIYQLAYCDRIPQHAAVNETVSLLGRKNKYSRGFINAVLREYIRKTADAPFPMPEKKSGLIKYLSVNYSVCEPLCKALVSAYGGEKTEKMFISFCNQTPITLRVNTLNTTKELLTNELLREGFAVAETKASPFGLKAEGTGIPSSVTAKQNATAFVEDEAAQLAVYLLAPKPGDRMLDACASPGGKSFSAAMMMNNCGEIVSCDIHESRLSLIKSGADALGIKIIKTEARDSALPPADGQREKFDCVLCDVPCSGYGVLRKKPEIRYKAPNESVELVQIQTAILEASAEYLKPGGRLVYSTCTVLPRENEAVINDFLKRHSEFCAEPFELADGTAAEDGMLTLTPDMSLSTDGFFIARLIKK